MSNVFGHNAALPGGRSPFWIQDDAFAEFGLGPGDAVAVDSRLEAVEGDLVLAEVVVNDGESDRVVRQYFEESGVVRLACGNPAIPDLVLPNDQVFIVGVVTSRIRYEPVDEDRTRVVEEPISRRPSPR